MNASDRTPLKVDSDRRKRMVDSDRRKMDRIFLAKRMGCVCPEGPGALEGGGEADPA